METDIDIAAGVLDALYRDGFQPVRDAGHERIGGSYDLVGTAEIFRHVVDGRAHRDQPPHVSGVGAAEFVYVLVVVAYSDHAHVFVLIYKHFHEGELVCAHVLRLIDDEYGFGDLAAFHLPFPYRGYGITYYMVRILDSADFSEQIETI